MIDVIYVITLILIVFFIKVNQLIKEITVQTIDVITLNHCEGVEYKLRESKHDN